MKNNRGKLLLCISIFRTFASSMKIKICAPTREIFLAHGRDKKDSQTGADGNRI